MWQHFLCYAHHKGSPLALDAHAPCYCLPLLATAAAWNVIIDREVMLRDISGNPRDPGSPPHFVDPMMSAHKGTLHCPLAQNFCAKDTEQAVDKARRPGPA